MYGSRAGILSDIARNTGGESLLTNDIGQALQRAVAQASSYYLLGYAPQPLRRDGKFHKIDVKVTKGGLQVRARNGYWAPSVAELTASRRAAAEAALAPPVEAALSQLARLVALVDRRGRRLTELPVSQHAGEWMIDVQLQSLARGGYLVLFELTSGDTRAAAYLPVRIE